MTTTAGKPAPLWAVHSWDGKEWHVDTPDDMRDKAAAERLLAHVQEQHPEWGSRLVDETL